MDRLVQSRVSEPLQTCVGERGVARRIVARATPHHVVRAVEQRAHIDTDQRRRQHADRTQDAEAPSHVRRDFGRSDTVALRDRSQRSFRGIRHDDEMIAEMVKSYLRLLKQAVADPDGRF